MSSVVSHRLYSRRFAHRTCRGFWKHAVYAVNAPVSLIQRRRRAGIRSSESVKTAISLECDNALCGLRRSECANDTAPIEIKHPRG
jgi:hypothetical protein